MVRSDPRRLLTLVVAVGWLVVTGCGVGTIEGPPGSSDDDPSDDGVDARRGADADESTGIDARIAVDAADPDPDPADARPGTADARPATADARPATADARPATADARPAAADARPTTPDAGTGPDCRNPGSWPAAWTAFEDRVLVLINQRRAAGATCGSAVKPAVGALRMDADLREAARCHSLDMAVNGYFGHDSQDGRSPWDRIDEAGYTASATGENIAAGYADAEAAVVGWMASDGHCNNIMAAGSNETGIGYGYQQGSPFGGYWTETFGRR